MKGNKRALYKTLSWRALASTDTFIISLIVMKFTNNPLTIATYIATIEILNKVILYFLHEKAWQKWGEK